MNNQRQPNQERLKELIHRLATEIDIERIYIRQIDVGGLSTEQLVIILSKTNKKTSTEIQFLVNMFFEQEQYYGYKLYQASKVKDVIHQGRLRFYTICTEEALLYRKPDSAYTLFPERVDVSWLFQKVEKDYQKETEKIRYFEQGAQFYLEQESYAFAAYMVQQAMELSYRAIEMWAVGMDKITHSIANHQRYLAPYVPELGALFNDEKKEDIIALSLLDDAYLDVRYKTNYRMAKDTLLYCMQKLHLLMPWVQQSYQQLLVAFKTQYKRADPYRVAYMQVMHDVPLAEQQRTIDDAKPPIQEEESVEVDKITENIQDGYLQEWIQALTGCLKVEQIYSFGYRSKQRLVSNLSAENSESYHHHYDLLLITHEEMAKVATQEGQVNAMNRSYSVTLIAHSPSSVEKALREDNRFFHQVLQKGTLLYGEGLVVPDAEVPSPDDKRMKAHMEHLWFKRITRARAFLTSAYAALDEAYEDVPVSLFNQSLEQVCLGIIEVFLGYHPNRHKLHHLLNLCQNFCALPVEVFPNWTEEDRTLYKLLDQSVNDIRFRREWCVNPTDIDLISRKCKIFLQKADDMVKEYCCKVPEM